MITRWGVQLPEAVDLPALPHGIVLHWTGGGPRANRKDLKHYHYVVEVDGTVRQGDIPVAANMRLISGGTYAQHTGGWNSYRVGIAAAGMRGYRSRQEPGDAPLTATQVNRMCELTAYFTRLARINPVDPAHVCTHQEVWTIHGVRGQRNHQKVDINFLPFKPELEPGQVGPFLRRLVALHEYRLDAIPEPSLELAEPDRPLEAERRPPRLDYIDDPGPEHVEAAIRAGGWSREAVRAGLAVAEILLHGGATAGVPGAEVFAAALATWRRLTGGGDDL